jgi:hypothetical protein
MTHPYDSIPELAGVATYESAARIGLSVEENVQRLLLYHWTERRLMREFIARIPWMPIWEAKCAFALHQWQCAERVDELRARIAEMRNPVPNLDTPPATVRGTLDLESAFAALREGRSPEQVLRSVYEEILPAVANAYRDHVARTNPLVDYPTRRLLRFALVEIDEAIEWGLHAIAGVSRVSDDTPSPDSPFHPRRDARFQGQHNFEFPPHVVYNMPEVPADERNLALLCKRALEMDVPEMMASFMTERAAEPWEFYRDYSRQLWDEARHAMMGTVALEARGVDWKREVPLNVSFALRLNLHAEPIERQMMLYAIEQSLMPGETGKRFEYETAVAAGDGLSAHFHDYDWADEVLHAQIGRRALKREGISSAQASERAREIHDKTWAALDRYRDREPQVNWWPAFVRRVLGKESAVADRTLGTINIFTE